VSDWKEHNTHTDIPLTEISFSNGIAYDACRKMVDGSRGKMGSETRNSPTKPVLPDKLSPRTPARAVIRTESVSPAPSQQRRVFPPFPFPFPGGGDE
jgi:hypothetical protein